MTPLLDSSMPEPILLVAGVIAGAVASVAGFGIGSILTPLASLWIDARLAVAAVSIPHLVGTALRFWLLKGHVDRRVMWSFGLASAAGGVLGALLQRGASDEWLMLLLAMLLLFVAVSELTGMARRLVFRGRLAWIAGAASGLLGGLVGNQGGLRSAALLNFRLSRDSFVATATVIGLFVDVARMPIYFWRAGGELLEIRSMVVASTIGVVIGTLAGGATLRRIPEAWFRRIVAVLLAVLGAWLAARAI
jgi:uncharacterized membrane protein YfcA